FLAGGLGASLFSCLHALVTIVFLGNQVVSGLALTILGVGLADYLGTPYIGTKLAGFSKFAFPGLAHIPWLGPIFFRQDALVYCSYLAVPLVWFVFNRTRLGLALDAAGEYPPAARAAGLSVTRLRWLGVVGGAFFVGLGGAYLSLAYTQFWTTNLAAGRGWIAVALV
ncbi:ABC-type transporter, integral membrane subunit, partial [Desulfovibrio sp. X2]|uniref:ABC transporter permease n=1 Tax=Desulfovibrio sp. X2 TaxID=941449 RepID=UPI000358B6F2